jgi:hypothetical protein
MAGHGKAWRGELSQGKELLKRNSANAVNIIPARQGTAGQGAAWQGMAGLGKARNFSF